MNRGYVGVNDFDKAVREHDIAYSRYKHTESPHKYNSVLAKKVQ